MSIVLLLWCFLLPLLGPLHAGPLPDEPVLQMQENFDVNRFMGKWYDIVVASTSPWMKRHEADAAIGTAHSYTTTPSKQTRVTRIVCFFCRHGSCKSISGEYQLSKTPGRFHCHSTSEFSRATLCHLTAACSCVFAHVRWNADVDVYVPHTIYDEYALVVMYKHKPGGEKNTSVKLLLGQQLFLPVARRGQCYLLKEILPALVSENACSSDFTADL
ncbi:protein AMBP-like [Carassius carassius]|uniref:protein AMBP-like n=1 Tax=Carassius carassius TaxID=217509 RepID=UPI00286920D4|nr:protein AMBP-like [Carassius carassius]